jgi:hypothetical protein
LTILAATAATIGAAYSVWIKGGWIGVAAVALYVSLAVMVYMNRINRRREEAEASSGTV